MSLHETLAILRPDTRIDTFPGCEIVQEGPYCVLLGAPPKRRLKPPNRKTALKAAVERQRRLEDLMAFGTVLPVLAGMVLDPGEVSRFLLANRPLLDHILGDLAGMQQYQITLSWDPSEAARHFASGEPNGLEQHANALRARIDAQLDPVAHDRIALPRDSGMVANHVVLIADGAVPALDQALEAIDAIWTEGLRIRLIGPSPAVSFASLGWRRPTQKQGRAAAAALGLSASADAAAITAARRTALKSCAPEHRNTILDAAHLLTVLNRSDKPVPVAYLWREGTAAAEDPWKQVA